tara:strand:+ start:4987 stop:6255 length:1269 start_codon:yes stop_codon:yes gene_type:complete
MNLRTLLIIGFTWPEPNATAAGGRMLQLIRFFLQHDCEIIFASTAKTTHFSMDLNGLGIEKIQIRLNDDGFDSFMNGLKPDMVLFDRFLTEEQFGWRVAQFAPNAIRILDTEDLHSLRHSRETAFKSKVAHTNAHWLGEELTLREMASIYRCDLALIISNYEMGLLQEVLKIDPSLLFYLPFLIDGITDDVRENWASFETREHFMFLGNGKHSPNVDAINWLRVDLWPLIRKSLPKANFYVYGTYMPQKVLQMHCPKDGFYIKGPLEQLDKTMGSTRINLAPLRFGAGLKGKLIDSMLFGIPSVTTNIGAEGMHHQLPWNGSIADTKDTFAQAAVDLYTDRNAWEAAQRNGAVIINELFDPIGFKDGLYHKIQQLELGLEAHRTSNFIGAMLRHHTLASTKYLSKWIALKNGANSKKEEGTT